MSGSYYYQNWLETRLENDLHQYFNNVWDNNTYSIVAEKHFPFISGKTCIIIFLQIRI